MNSPDPRLEAAVLKHLDRSWRQPVADHNLRAFDELFAAARDFRGRIHLDTGCGVGESTARLASLHPDDLVLGLDKSAHRLDVHTRSLFPKTAGNYRLFRIDLEDFWRLWPDSGLTAFRQYLFYPNPWPKSVHLLRRWPAHPVFPWILDTCPNLEVRTNLEFYHAEFQLAVDVWNRHSPVVLAGKPGVSAEGGSFRPDPVLTPFERKYLAHGQNLWRLRVTSLAK